MKQRIVLTVELLAEVDEPTDVGLVADRVNSALTSWCDSSETGLFGDVGFTEAIIVTTSDLTNELWAACKKLVMHRHQGDLHSVDYQRIESILQRMA